MTRNLDPNIMAALDEERDVASSRQNNYRTLKLQKRESALVRLLPAQLGPRKTWFARIARHWVGGRPYACVRQTSVDFGGDPKAHCPLCALEQKYSQARNQATRDAARRIGAFPKWLIYCWVWELIDDRNRSTQTAKGELYIPNEFWVTRDGYNELANMWERSLKTTPPYGFLDPVRGCDFVVTRDNRNTLKFQREGASPIMPDKSADEIFDLIDAAMANVKLPETTPPDADKLEELELKAEDFIRRAEDEGGGGRRDDGPPRRRGEMDEDEDADAPRRQYDDRRRAPADEPSARRRFEESEAPRRREPEEAPTSRRRETDEAPAPRRRDHDEAPAEPSRRREQPEAQSRRAAPVAEPSRREPPPSRSEPARGSNPDDFEAKPGADEDGGADDPAANETAESAPPAISRRRQLPAPPARAKIEDNADELPPERHDPAPAAPAHSATASTSNAPQRSLSSDMRSRVSRLGSASL